MLSPGAELELTQAFHRADYQAFDECNDYSFDPTARDFVTSPRIVVLQDATVVWGAIPKGAYDLAATDADAGVSDAKRDARGGSADASRGDASSDGESPR
jgi:hypothetical protein